MTKPSVYLETTIISYLAARPSRDLITAAHQVMTHRWWTEKRSEFDVYVSQAVRNEVRRGDQDAVARRVELARDLQVLDINPAVLSLARAFTQQAIVPPRASQDALHMAVSAVHGMNFLLTWNCRHLHACGIVRRRTMIDDPIVEEVRQVRDAYAAQFNYDLDKIYEDLRRQQKEDGVQTVTLLPRPAEQRLIAPKPQSAA